MMLLQNLMYKSEYLSENPKQKKFIAVNIC